MKHIKKLLQNEDGGGVLVGFLEAWGPPAISLLIRTFGGILSVPALALWG